MNPPATPDPLSSPPRQLPRVLLVDDEPSVLALGTVILESNGYPVTGVTDGAEALDAIAQSQEYGDPVEIVVLDMTLPGGASGFEVLEAIQVRHPQLRVVACSGYFQEDARELCLGLGFAEILQKPYTADRLVNCVRRVHLTANKPEVVSAIG